MKTLHSLKLFLMLILLTTMSCEEIILDKSFTFGNESEFRINQLYSTSDGQCTFRITEISDSRCPEGVVCIWAGEVTVKGKWTAYNEQTNVELHSLVKDQEIQPEGYTITIIDAKPYPKYGTETKPEDLVITLKIQKN
ncbi:MAG: hypothetical protein WAO52_20930 [Prolixibacteraceae bacterium]